MEYNFADEVEVAPKGDAHCKGCYEKIYKGDIRLKSSRHDIKYGIVNYYHCIKCMKRLLKEEEDRCLKIYTKIVGLMPTAKMLAKKNKVQIKNNRELSYKEKIVKELEK